MLWMYYLHRKATRWKVNWNTKNAIHCHVLLYVFIFSNIFLKSLEITFVYVSCSWIFFMKGNLRGDALQWTKGLIPQQRSNLLRAQFLPKLPLITDYYIFKSSIFKLKVKTINEKLSCVCCIFNNFYPPWIISSQSLSHLWRWILCLISVKLWAYSNNAFPSRFSLMRREMWRHHITKTRYQALRCTSRSFNSW